MLSAIRPAFVSYAGLRNGLKNSVSFSGKKEVVEIINTVIHSNETKECHDYMYSLGASDDCMFKTKTAATMGSTVYAAPEEDIKKEIEKGINSLRENAVKDKGMVILTHDPRYIEAAKKFMEKEPKLIIGVGDPDGTMYTPDEGEFKPKEYKG